MWKQVLVLIAVIIALAGLTWPASAFVPGQSPLIAASQELGNTIEAKWKKEKKWKKWKKIPPGWSRGRKVGWGGGSVPPGHRR
jgi:hypothetical protein